MQICEQALRGIIESSGPVKLVIGGPPCEDVALVNADRTGVKGTKSGLLHIFFVVLGWLTILQPEQEVCFLVENTARMAAHNKQCMGRRFGVHDAVAADHIEFNSLLLGPVSCPRVHWTNLPGARGHMHGQTEVWPPSWAARIEANIGRHPGPWPHNNSLVQ